MFMYPAILLIDSEEGRAQRLARLLTLAGFRPFVAKTVNEAYARAFHERILPQTILLGQSDMPEHYLFSGLLRRLGHTQGREIPYNVLPVHIPDAIPLHADSSHKSAHILSKECLEVLDTIGCTPSAIRDSAASSQSSLVLDALPAIGLNPRVSQHRRSRNSHFLQVLKVAHSFICVSTSDSLGQKRWETLMNDVGLAHYCSPQNWPADDEECTIAPEYLSCLNQAVAFSLPDNPVKQLRRWSDAATESSLQKHVSSALILQLLKFVPSEKTMSIALNAFTQEMNDIRGEELHLWKRQPDGSYWLVHYSNLYVYGRIAPAETACHVWIASLESTLRLVGLDATWAVTEKECSCQTLTGHCLFEIKPR